MYIGAPLGRQTAKALCVSVPVWAPISDDWSSTDGLLNAAKDRTPTNKTHQGSASRKCIQEGVVTMLAPVARGSMNFWQACAPAPVRMTPQPSTAAVTASLSSSVSKALIMRGSAESTTCCTCWLTSPAHHTYHVHNTSTTPQVMHDIFCKHVTVLGLSSGTSTCMRQMSCSWPHC